MSDANERRALKIALFSTSQLAAEKKYDIPVFLFGDVLYSEMIDKKNVVKYQEYAFPMMWQAFFDSILFDDYRHILKNQALVFLSIFISKNV